MVRKLFRILDWCVIAMLVIAVGCILVAFSWEMFTQATLGPKIEARYGFRAEGPYIRTGDSHIEILHLRVAPNGPLAKAGAANWVLVADPETSGQLLRRLNVPKGTVVSLQVTPGGNGPEVAKRPVTTITMTAP